MFRFRITYLLSNSNLHIMAKKKKKAISKNKLTKRLTKQLKKAIKVHGKDLVLGFVTGLVTELIADKTTTGKKAKSSKKASSEEQPTLATAVEETTKAVVNKVKTAVSAKAPASRKEPVLSMTAGSGAAAEPDTEATV